MHEKLKEVQDKFIDGIAMVSELMGLSDAMGRIYGLLYMSSLPVSLDDICARLSLTKGTVSLYLRQMEERDVIRRTWVRNSRKKFYEIRPDLWRIMAGKFQEKFRERIDVTLSTVYASTELIEQSLGELEGEERNNALIILGRLSVFEDFNLNVLKFLERFLMEELPPEVSKEIEKIEIGGN